MTTHACTDVLWLTATDGFHEAHCRVCDRVVPAAELLSPAELWLVRKISDRTQSILKVFPPGHAALKVLHNAVVHMLLAVFVDVFGARTNLLMWLHDHTSAMAFPIEPSHGPTGQRCEGAGMAPITDRVERSICTIAGDFNCVPVETARELEAMCEELYRAAKYWTPEEYAPPALARYKAMKEKAK